MKQVGLLILFSLSMAHLNGQVVLSNTTLPEIGDIYTYTTFTHTGDTSSYRFTGENQIWTYDSLTITGTSQEEFEDISGTALADSFPEANMIVSLTGFQSAAIRNDSSIDIIGLAINSFSAFGVDGSANFDQPFSYRKTPFTFGDSIHDSFSFSFQFASDLIPGLDSIEIPIPFATLDSLRLLFDFGKTESAIGWGTLELYNEMYDILQIKQENTVDSKIELGVTLFGNLIWIDASAFLGDFSFNQNTTSYKFLRADSKLSILEFSEFRSPTGQLIVNGRLDAEIISNVEQIQFENIELSLAPNPSQSQISILGVNAFDHADIYISSTNGQVVQTVSNHQLTKQLDVSGLPSGQYHLTVLTNNRSFTKSFQIVR